MVAKSSAAKPAEAADTDLQSPDLKSLKFEAALNELETIVRSMETQANGPQDLENAIAAYQRGMALLQHCQGQLKAAEAQIRILTPNGVEGSA